MHIHYLLTDLNHGGAAGPVPELVALMRAQGHTVRVLAIMPKDRRASQRLDDAGIGWELLSDGPKQFLKTAKNLLRIIKEDPPDILWTSLTRATIYGSLAGWLRGIPVVSWQHNAWLRPQYRILLFLVRRLSAFWVADSNAVAQFASKALGLPMSRIEVWPLFRTHAAGSVSQAWKEGRFRFCSLGRLHKDKRYSTLISAAVRVREMQPELARRIDFIIGGEGREREILAGQITAAGLDNVHLAGFVEDANAFLSSMHAYIQCSHHEGLCIAAHEAMEAGLPVITTKVGEIQHSVRESTCGLLVDIDEVEQLAEAIMVMASNPQRSASWGESGREFVRGRYSESDFRDAGLKILKRAAALPGKPDIKV